MNIIDRFPVLRVLVPFKATEITPDLVKDYWRYGTRIYGVEVVPKSDSSFMKTVGEVLDALNIQNRELFMNCFVTTVFGKIYPPFEIGVPGENGHWSLVSQMGILAHELTHVLQDRTEQALGFEWRYLTSSIDRAWYEAQAMGCDFEFYWRYLRIPLSPDSKADMLKHYACTSQDIEMARRILRTKAMMAKKGAIASEVGKKLYLGYLDARMNH